MSRDRSQRADSATTPLLAAGVAVGPLFMVLVTVQALARPGFDLTRHPASLLSLGESGWIQVANFIASGLLVVAFASGVRRALHLGRASTWGPVLLAAHGVGLNVPGSSRLIPRSGFAGHCRWLARQRQFERGTAGVGFVLAFVSVTLASLVFARLDIAHGQRGWAAYAVASAVVALVLSQWPILDGVSPAGMLAFRRCGRALGCRIRSGWST
jgi:hypothetical protein